MEFIRQEKPLGVIYHLHSFSSNQRIRFKIFCAGRKAGSSVDHFCLLGCKLDGT
ncbi:MAG: hypothetical protein U0T82_01755 [Bacteroidales bacterium]